MRAMPLRTGVAALALIATSCGGGATEPTTMTDLVQSIRAAETCDELVTHYEDLVAALVEEMGDTTLEDLAGDVTPSPGLADPTVIAFVNDEIDGTDLEALAVEVASWPGVTAVGVMTKADALDEFRELFADQPSLIEVAEEDPTVLPASLRIQVDPESRPALIDRLESLPGIRQTSAVSTELIAMSVVYTAAFQTGRSPAFIALDERANDLGCPVEGIGRQADLSGIDSGGQVGDLILEAARAGIGG